MNKTIIVAALLIVCSAGAAQAGSVADFAFHNALPDMERAALPDGGLLFQAAAPPPAYPPPASQGAMRLSVVKTATGLSILYPGAGHFVLGTPTAVGLGILHIALESLFVSGLLFGIYEMRDSYGGWDTVVAALFTGFNLVMMVIHRTTTALYTGIWAKAIERKQEGWKSPRVGLHVADRGREWGLSLSLRF